MSDCFSHAGTQAWKRYTFVIFEGLVFDGFNRNTSLDSLYCPSGVIKEAQELAAKAFGADKTFFLVNGSTCGIQAAIMTVANRKTSL